MQNCFLIALLTFNYVYNSFYTQGIWEQNSTGDWVCVNVEGMDFDRAVEVCKHEVGHEIFAEVCEANWSKCANITR